MSNASAQPQRHALRLTAYDYRQPGGYFITMVSQGRAHVFGEIVDCLSKPNAAGRLIAEWWLELARKFTNVALDEYVVMPNHFHGILMIMSPTDSRLTTQAGESLSGMVQWFKTMTTNAYMAGVKTQGWPRFDGKLWQRSYYEHVIRDEQELADTRLYIRNNPAQWALDAENPDRAHT